MSQTATKLSAMGVVTILPFYEKEMPFVKLFFENQLSVIIKICSAMHVIIIILLFSETLLS